MISQPITNAINSKFKKINKHFEKQKEKLKTQPPIVT